MKNILILTFILSGYWVDAQRYEAKVFFVSFNRVEFRDMASELVLKKEYVSCSNSKTLRKIIQIVKDSTGSNLKESWQIFDARLRVDIYLHEKLVFTFRMNRFGGIEYNHCVYRRNLTLNKIVESISHIKFNDCLGPYC